MKTMVSPITRGQGNELLNKLEAAGLDSKLAQKVIDSKDNDLAVKAVRLIENGGFEPSTSQKYAREIMGRNFFGIEEAIKYFGVNPSRAQIAALSEVPFTEEVLESYKDTHILVAMFPMSILDIRGSVGRELFHSYDPPWHYNRNYLARDRGEVDWCLVCRTPVPDSTLRNWDEQQTLLDKSEEVPSARIMVYTIIGHHLVTAERLFEDVWVRTSSVAPDGFHVNVGRFNQDGLVIGVFGDEARRDIGVSSAWKS